MGQTTIENLLKAANSSTEGDTSINLAKRQFLEEHDCETFFSETRARMLRVDEWKKQSSVTEYDLFDEAGQIVNDRPISIGIFIRIGLYGGGKYDWVRVSSIVDEQDEFVITVKPTYDPTEERAVRNSVSHFFDPQASNNFCLQRDGKAVAFYVIGINEKTNTKFADGLIESARNVAVANVGYYTGLQKAVWKEFCSNFLEPDRENSDQ